MFNFIIKVLTFALALLAGLSLTAAYALEAEAAVYSGNQRVYTTELNAVCKADGDTVYRIRVVNDSVRIRDFEVVTEGARLRPALDGWSLERRSRATVRLRVEEGERVRFAIRHKDEVLHYGTRKNVCGADVWY